MKCKACGAQLEEGARFCRNCGAHGAEIEASLSARPPEKSSGPNPRLLRFAALVAILSLAFLLLLTFLRS